MDDAELEQLAACEPVDSDTELLALLKRVRDAERERCAEIARSTCRLHPLYADCVLQNAIAANILEDK